MNASDIDDAGFGVSVNFDNGNITVAEPTMLDTDLDGIANFYDEDDDGDGVNDAADAFPLDSAE